MRIPRIFQDTTFSLGIEIELNERATKHLVQVLRFEVGREIILFNGLGGEFRAKLSKITKRSASATILEKMDVNRENNINIHLAQCVSKGDRFEFAIQKSVELGVQAITPVFSTRSQLKLNDERKDKKFQHWYQIILSACEQSGRTRLVTLHEPISFADFLAKNTISEANNKTNKIILNPEATDKLSNISLSRNYTLLIGPEGGFEEQEVAWALANGFQSIRLGGQILRTETAPIAAIAAICALEKVF